MKNDHALGTASTYWQSLGYAGPPTPRKNPEPAESDEALRDRMTRELYVGETDLNANRPTFRNPEVPSESATQESIYASIREWLDRYSPYMSGLLEDGPLFRMTARPIVYGSLHSRPIGVVAHVVSDEPGMVPMWDDDCDIEPDDAPECRRPVVTIARGFAGIRHAAESDE